MLGFFLYAGLSAFFHGEPLVIAFYGSLLVFFFGMVDYFDFRFVVAFLYFFFALIEIGIDIFSVT